MHLHSNRLNLPTNRPYAAKVLPAYEDEINKFGIEKFANSLSYGITNGNQADRYIIDGIDIRKLPYYSCGVYVPKQNGMRYDTADNKKRQEQLNSEMIAVLGPRVASVYLDINLVGARYAASHVPTEAELVIRGLLRKPEYSREYGKIYAEFYSAIMKYEAADQANDHQLRNSAKNEMKLCCEKKAALNKRDELRLPPHPSSVTQEKSATSHAKIESKLLKLKALLD